MLGPDMIAKYALNNIPIQESMHVPDTQGTLSMWCERANNESVIFNKVVALRIVAVTDSGANPMCPLCKKVCSLGEDDHVICHAMCGDLPDEKASYKFITKAKVTTLDGKCFPVLL